MAIDFQRARASIILVPLNLLVPNGGKAQSIESHCVSLPVGKSLSVTVSERKVDEKRRVTLPPNVDIHEGATVVMIASKDAAVIASNKGVAERLTEVLQELELDRKIRALDEWEKLIQEAGLSGLTSKDIESIIGKTMPRKRGGLDRSSGT